MSRFFHIILLILLLGTPGAQSHQRFESYSVHRLKWGYHYRAFGSDSVCMDSGNGYLVKKRVHIRDLEDEKCAAFASDSDVIYSESCDWQRLSVSGNEVVRVTFRCVLNDKENDWLVVSRKDTVPPLNSGYRFGKCDNYAFGEDSIVRMVYHIAKEVNVYQLKLVGRKVYFDTWLGQSDDNGLFTFDVPVGEDSFYGFYLSDGYVRWFSFFSEKTRKNIDEKSKRFWMKMDKRLKKMK
ncbi:MAG: hypothetical protein MJZ49_03240 [Bacteroidales bacterium]|nr:hypothetical protein [Bacteroidales bacterium]